MFFQYCEFRGVWFGDINVASEQQRKSIPVISNPQNVPWKGGLQTVLNWFVINFVHTILIVIIIFWDGERFDRNPPLLEN